MKLIFLSLHPNRANVYLSGTCYELNEDGEIECREWQDTNWSRVEDDYQFKGTTEKTRRISIFARDKYKAYYSFLVRPEPNDLVVWIDPAPYCPTTRAYHGHLDTPKQRIELNSISFRAKSIGGWMQLCAFAQKYAGQSPYVFKRIAWAKDKCRLGELDKHTCGSKSGITVGPWWFPERKDYEKDKDEEEAKQLKLWIHGKPSKLDTPKDIVRRAARRRIIKHRATSNDIQFFKTIFSLSEVGRWIKESQNKNTKIHE